ncbi:MAG: host-nuclease inhibitor Gam family protein [Christensenella sp.]
MAHKKVLAEPALASWAEVDRAMHELQVLVHDLNEISLQRDRKITEIKDESAKVATVFQNRIKKHEAEIREFTLAHRAELNGKSRKMNFGRLGFRISTALKLPTKGVDVLQKLKELGLHKCIKITETVDKDAMRRLPSNILLNTGAYIKQTEDFYYELDSEELADIGSTLEAL